MVTYEIKVTFKTEGECIYRKNEAEIPRIPYWSRFTEGGRVYGEDYIKVPAELPHKKRWLRHDLYYKAYHVEYLSHRMVRGDELYSPPNQDYLDRLVRIINPLPGESLGQKRNAQIPCNIFNISHFFCHNIYGSV